MDTEENVAAKSYVVAKAINTTSRRLKVGEPVLEGDDVVPYSVEDLASRGFLAGAGAAAAENAATKAEEPPNSTSKPKRG